MPNNARPDDNAEEVEQEGTSLEQVNVHIKSD